MTYKPTGIIHITGEPDTGKTIAALGAYHPKDTAYFFDDVKYPPIDKTEFKQFTDLVAKYSKLKLLEYYQAVMKEIEQLPEIDCIIFDTWTRFGKAIRYYAKANPYLFREKETFSKMGAIKGKEEWGETHRVESDVISALGQKCKALFLITHIKPQYLAGAATGRNIPDCGKSFDKVCNLRLWLRHNPSSGVPIALVLKRISKIEITENGIQPVNVLPRKITPYLNSLSIWDDIDNYWQDPVGNNKPAEFEIPTPYELSILDGILTEDQKQMWQAELKEKQREEKEEQEFIDSQYDEIKSFAISLVKEISKKSPNGQLPPPPIVASKILKEVQEKYPDVQQEDIVEMIGD